MMDGEPPLSLQPVAPAPNVQLQNEHQVVRQAGRQAILSFLEQHQCFSVLRASGKVVVFDIRIPIQLAFYALVEHDILAAPLWDSVQCQFVGILTVTDFIDILRYYKETGKDVAALATRSIAEFLRESEAPSNGQPPPFRFRSFVGVDSSCSLKQACQQLQSNEIDFLPVVFSEDMRVLACITYTNVLEHLVQHFREQRRLFDDTITDLGIGTYGNNLVVVHPTQTLSAALELMHRHYLSAIPVVDPATNKILGVYSRSDITFLTKATDAEDAVRNLELQLKDILAQTRQDVTTPDSLRTCPGNHTLQATFETFAQVQFNRLYVLDSEERLIGVVSARDLVAYFLSEETT